MSEKLIKVEKDGVVLSVHPTALDEHKGLGWREAASGAVETVFESVTASAPVEKPLSKWNKADLTAKAVELGLDVPEGATNAQLVTLIEEAGELEDK